ncbi:MAG: efflux RND transporter periplasmic adaptor subunit [Myxococcales bacterium]|nr:efflux RND transporter periplasmic adaptor subunit [Myxococcales bacterium]
MNMNIDNEFANNAPSHRRSGLIKGVAGLLVGLLVGAWAGPGIWQWGHQAWGGHDHGELEADGGAASFYTCGMHPWVILPKPGLCPICQMDLTPVDPAKLTGQVTIDPVVVQNMGVRVQPVTKGPIVRTVRAIGTIQPNEASVYDVTVRSEGYIEGLLVPSMGARVRKDEPLFKFYSPMVIAAQQEFAEMLRTTTDPELKRAAEIRMRNLDVPNSVIEDLKAGQPPKRRIPWLSPMDGVVTEKMVYDGMQVMPGMSLLKIADLSKVWAEITVYEQDLALVRVGQKVDIESPVDGGGRWEGVVTLVYPELDMDSRQAKVRIELPNQDGKLVPGMFVRAQLHVGDEENGWLVPREAVLRTGQRNLVLVSLGAGRFEPREVEVGPETVDGNVVILSGVGENDRVVTSGQFLLDSEVRLREGLARMIRGEMPSAEPAPLAPVSAHPVDPHLMLPPQSVELFETVIRTYLEIADGFASDSNEGVLEKAKKIGELMRTLRTGTQAGTVEFWEKHPETKELEDAAIALSEAPDLKSQRKLFTSLSDPLISLLKMTGAPKEWGEGLMVHHCPMFRKDKGGASWVQAPGKVRNPYFGSGMLACADDTARLPEWSIADGSSVAPSAAPPSDSTPNRGNAPASGHESHGGTP